MLATRINWHDATSLCSLKGKRLPTVDELILRYSNTTNLPQVSWSSTEIDSSRAFMVQKLDKKVFSGSKDGFLGRSAYCTRE
jgi:hypothetical protein